MMMGEIVGSCSLEHLPTDLFRAYFRQYLSVLKHVSKTMRTKSLSSYDGVAKLKNMNYFVYPSSSTSDIMRPSSFATTVYVLRKACDDGFPLFKLILDNVHISGEDEGRERGLRNIGVLSSLRELEVSQYTENQENHLTQTQGRKSYDFEDGNEWIVALPALKRFRLMESVFPSIRGLRGASRLESVHIDHSIWHPCPSYLTYASSF